jgi:sulfatase modifying factor 1
MLRRMVLVAVVGFTFCVSLAFGKPLAEGDKAGAVRDDNELKMKLLWCPAGKFKMGPEKGRFEVTLTKGFWLGQTGVTQEQWKAVMKTTPWTGKESVKEGANYPATYVDWNDAVKFCDQLTASEEKAGRLPAGWRYALPTEAQREYATRAGTQTAFSYGNDEKKFAEFGWSEDTVGGERHPHPVGLKKANPWGFFDLHGNVWESCRDSHRDRLSDGVDPFHNDGSAIKVNRGGSFRNFSWQSESGYRHTYGNTIRASDLGFRAALVYVGKAP